MKAEKLMIGDWVYNIHNRQYEQVKAIEQTRVTLAYNDLYDYDEIEPIPLAPEILEKNGFVLREGCTSAWDLHLDGCYSIHISGNNKIVPMSLTIYVPSGYSPNGSKRQIDEMSVSYVHKLQHALRLCSVEKEIEL